jgi:hypothetical protein
VIMMSRKSECAALFITMARRLHGVSRLARR